MMSNDDRHRQIQVDLLNDPLVAVAVEPFEFGGKANTRDDPDGANLREPPDEHLKTSNSLEDHSRRAY